VCNHGRHTKVAVFAAASEAFSAANINCSIQESLDRFKPVMERAKAASLPVRGYVSCVLGCPYEGRVRPRAVVEVSGKVSEIHPKRSGIPPRQYEICVLRLLYVECSSSSSARMYVIVPTGVMRRFSYVRVVSSRQVARSLLHMGCYSVSLGDTIGAGTAGSTLNLIESLKAAGVPLERTAMHFHDTYGQALANILVALEEVRSRLGN